MMGNQTSARSILVAAVSQPGLIRSGTDQAETLYGGAFDDSLYGGGGDDLIRGFAGDDDVDIAAPGDATVYGGAGEDSFVISDLLEAPVSTWAEHSLYGGSGDDRVFFLGSYEGNSTLYGGLGIDTVDYYFNSKDFRIDLRRVIDPTGPQPDDIILGVENAFGGSGNDTLFGNAVANRLGGERGDDVLFGGAGNDRLSGMNGNDSVFGGDGRDTLSGNPGDDVLTGGKGFDVLFGFKGADRFVFNLQSDAGAHDRIMDFEVGVDKIVLGEVAAADGAPDVTFTVRANGVTIVTVGDAGDPLFTIAALTGGGTLTQADVQFDFLD